MHRLVAVGLCLLLAGAQDPADKVKALVDKLDSDEIAVRDEAAKELVAIGYPAVPALRAAALASSGEKKVLLERIVAKLTVFGRPNKVTLESKDRPLRDIAADLERQTGIPIRLVGAAADAKSTVSAKDTVVWKVVEDICRARGDLMYRFIDDVIEIYSSPFRALPSVDAHGMRFFIDRFILDGAMEKYAGHIREHVAVLVPRGARVVWVGFKIDELTDDKGNNWALEPERGMGFDGGPPRIVEPNGFQALPTSRKFLYPFYVHRSNQRPPADDCAKISRLRGVVEVVLAEGLHRIESIPDPLARPSTPAKEELPSLGIPIWKIEDGVLNIRYTAAWNADTERELWFRLKPLLVLNEAGGDWQVSPRWHSWSRLSANDVDRRDNVVSFTWPAGSRAVSLDLVAPHPIVKYEIPFDFQDLSLR
jgi:hypothetical protein